MIDDDSHTAPLPEDARQRRALVRRLRELPVPLEVEVEYGRLPPEILGRH